jgi:hypothetical protein
LKQHFLCWSLFSQLLLYLDLISLNNPKLFFQLHLFQILYVLQYQNNLILIRMFLKICLLFILLKVNIQILELETFLKIFCSLLDIHTKIMDHIYNYFRKMSFLLAPNLLALKQIFYSFFSFLIMLSYQLVILMFMVVYFRLNFYHLFFTAMELLVLQVFFLLKQSPLQVFLKFFSEVKDLNFI